MALCAAEAACLRVLVCLPSVGEVTNLFHLEPLHTSGGDVGLFGTIHRYDEV